MGMFPVSALLLVVRAKLTNVAFPDTINVTQDTEAIIVLAQLDKRYFKELSGRYKWGLDFTLFRKDDASVVGRSFHSAMWERSVKMEAKLKTGIYVVQVSSWL